MSLERYIKWTTITMTTVYERTRSVVETGAFLEKLARDKSLPGAVRSEAKQLLRHYPTAGAVRLAGRCEAVRQDQVLKLPLSPSTLHPALATWPLLDPFFCDPQDPYAPKPCAPAALDTSPKLQSILGTKGRTFAYGIQVLGLALPSGGGLSIEYRCFASARAQVLSRATVVLGSRTRARNWFVSSIQSLDRRQPCTMMLIAHEFVLVMDVLTRLEHGIF